MDPAKGTKVNNKTSDSGRRSGTSNSVDSSKTILAIVFIAAIFIMLPQIFASGGDFSRGFSGGGSGTLSEPESGQVGVIAISFNGGNSFEESKLHEIAIPNVFTIKKISSLYFAGTDRGLLVSKDSGLNWYPFSDLENQIDSGTAIYDFAAGPENAIYVSAFKNDHGVIYVTRDNFFTATPIWTEGKMPVRAIASDQNFLYMGLDDGRLLRYSFFAGTFKKIYAFKYGIRSLVFVESDSGGPRHLFAGLENGRVFSDSGTRANFAEVSPPKRSAVASRDGLRIVNDVQSGRTLYLASLSGIFRSVDQGSDWRELNSILPEKAKISALAVQNGKIFATVDSKLYKSSDGGATWSVVEPLPTTRKLGALFVGNGGNLVVVGTSN
ncbi:MAG: hypothetical protein HYT12_04390 [Candidatus Liptonbacteria bacterium]|nr:hypothetical protein [Candidatus Liptonbacteria bacterium]